jgi:hypothetical protein
VKKTPSSLLPQFFKKIGKKSFSPFPSSSSSATKKSRKNANKRERDRERERDPYATNANKASATDAPGRLLDASL